MSTRVIFPPLASSFFQNLSNTKDEVILVAPYVKYNMIEKIVPFFNQDNLDNPTKLILLTAISTRSFLSGSSDIEAIEALYKYVPNVSIYSIGNLHAKCYIFDSSVAIITSGNLTPNGLNDNIEIGVEINDKATVLELRNRLIKSYITASTLIKPKEILKIRQTIEEYIEHHGAQLTELSETVEKVEIKLKKYNSKRIKIDSSDIVTTPNISLPKIDKIATKTKDIFKNQEAILPNLDSHLVMHDKPKNQEVNEIMANAHDPTTVSKSDSNWLMMYGLLKNYLFLIHDMPSRDSTYQGQPLGWWADTQMKMMGRKTMPTLKKQMLRDIGLQPSEGKIYPKPKLAVQSQRDSTPIRPLIDERHGSLDGS